MEERTKLILWVTLDLIFLAVLLYSGAKWIEINNTIKNPCAVCSAQNETLKTCIDYQRKINPLGIEINLTEILKEENKKINYKTLNAS